MFIVKRRKLARRKKVTILSAIFLVTLISLIHITRINHSIETLNNAINNLNDKLNDKNNVSLTYKDGINAVSLAYTGLKFITDKKTGVPIGFLDKNNVINQFNYKKSLSENSSVAKVADFNMGLSTVSAYMGTGDKKFLKVAEATADLLEEVLPENGIVPCYNFKTRKNTYNNIIMTGSNGQATILEYISFLAKINPKYTKLMDKLAEGLINHGISKRNNLAWFQINSQSGYPVYSQQYGYESELGSQSVTCAEALLSAYETSPSKDEYKQKALDILKAIWKCRNRRTNLISEIYDIKNNRRGSRLYPGKNFRYDDMGGAYIRGLCMAYSITKDPNIEDIALQYIPALIEGTWDTSINGGAFRYLSNIYGEPKSSSVEIMHGLFIATLLNANDTFYAGTNSDIIQKCSLNADHTIVDGFAVKNGMAPHLINNDGNYENQNSDSQLGYAVLQYPYGYEKLSEVTGDDKYRETDNKIVKTLLERHKIGNNKTSPKGFLNIVETTPPYGFEENYSLPKLMFQEMYLASYLLYNSIHPSKDVKVDWYNGYNPSVFGLVNDMPFWDINNVSFQGNELVLSKVTGKGSLDLTDMGFNIESVKKDGASYKNYKGNLVYTEAGTHKYSIVLKR